MIGLGSDKNDPDSFPKMMSKVLKVYHLSIVQVLGGKGYKGQLGTKSKDGTGHRKLKSFRIHCRCRSKS